MIQILFGVPALATGERRLTAAHLVVIPLKVLREYLGHGSLLGAHRSSCRVLLHIRRADWPQFLIDSPLGTNTDKILWR